MLLDSKGIKVEYLGSEELQISETEKKKCNFYSVKATKNLNKEIIDFEVGEGDYFLLKNFLRKQSAEKITASTTEEEIKICTFNRSLVIDGEELPKTKTKTVSEKEKEDFLYALAMYHLINEDFEGAEIALAQTGDINAYSSVTNCYSLEEKDRAIKTLNQIIDGKEKRFKHGKVNIRINTLEEEPLCLLEVLQQVLSDKDSSLLWDYSYKYKRIGTKKNLMEDKYKFIRPKFGFGQVEGIVIGSKELNIGFRVKIAGEVINTENKLKLDAHLYRDYILILNGNINTEFIGCKLSKELKRKFRKEKIIKAITKVYGEEIITLDIRQLNSTNKRVLKSLNSGTIAEYLYKIEELSCRQWALNTLIKQLDKLEYEDNLPLKYKDITIEQASICQSYRVNQKGLYSPIEVEGNEGERPYQVYPARVLEWKIEKFPKAKEQEKALKEYEKLIKAEPSNSSKTLKEELLKVKEEKALLQYKVNVVRLSCGLSNRTVFLWDNEIEKEKKETDKVLKMNVVVGEKVLISTKTINNIKVRQDSYTVLTRCD